MDFVYQFNEEYVPYAGVSISSIIDSHKGCNLTFHILGEGLSGQSIFKLKLLETQKIIIKIYSTDIIIEKMKNMNLPAYRNSYAANLRMFLPLFLDVSIERILYLDADTVIVKNLQELFSIDLKGYCAAMVLDSLAAKYGVLIGLDECEPYFNSGVILFNMTEWRNGRFTEQIVEHIKKVRNFYPAPDQDLINIVCKGKIKILPMKYNYQPIHNVISLKCYTRTFMTKLYYSCSEIERTKNEVKIMHCFRFLGEFPWHQNNMHPFSKDFDIYLTKSPWCDYKKKKAVCPLILKIEKFIYIILPNDIWGYIFYVMHKLFMLKVNKMSIKQKANRLM